MKSVPALHPARWLTAIVATVLIAPGALAEEHAEWEHRVDVTGSKAMVEIRSESEEAERAVEFEYDRNKAAVEFHYEAEVGETESEASMEVQFHQVFEYEDANRNGRYDAGEPIVSAYSLHTSGEDFLVKDAPAAVWGPIEKSARTSDNGVPGTKFSSSAAIGNGTLRLDFYVFGDAATLGAAKVEPTEIKLDIAIRNYPLRSSTSALALLLEAESEAEVETDSKVDSDEDGVVASTRNAKLLFAWKEFATAGGERTPVHTTVLQSRSQQAAGERASEELLVFSYRRSPDLLHDPTMGVALSNAAPPKGFLPAPAIAAVATAVVVAALWARRG